MHDCVMIRAQLGDFRKMLDASLREKVVDNSTVTPVSWKAWRLIY